MYAFELDVPALYSFEVDVRGGRLFVEEAGDGPPVLLLHAGCTDRRVWDLTMPMLVDAGRRVIRYDTRGFGRSAPTAEPFSAVDDALAVLDAADIERAHFVGVSQGAATSIDVALQAPGRVRSLTLIAPEVTGFTWPALPRFERLAAAMGRGDAPALAMEVARLWAPMSFAADGTHDPDDHAVRIVLDQAEAFLRGDSQVVRGPSTMSRIGEITAPTLVVLGDRDLETITQIGESLAAGVTGARRVVLPDADHMVPLRQPERLHELLVSHHR